MINSYVWQPVDSGEHVDCACGDPGCASYISCDDGWLFLHNAGDGSICLPDDCALCHLVPAPTLPPLPNPDWSQAPTWAQWWAVDATGAAYWHEDEPYIDHAAAAWLNRDMDMAHDRQRLAGEIEIPLGIDWRTSLRRKPQPGQAQEGSDGRIRH